MDAGLEELLRRIALNDEATLDSVLDGSVRTEARGLSAKTVALVRLAGLLALQSGESTLEWAVSAALDAGADDDEVVEVLVALTPLIGSARASSSAAAIASALGHGR